MRSLAVLALALALAGCSSAPPWTHDLGTALELSRKQAKPVLVLVSPAPSTVAAFEEEPIRSGADALVLCSLEGAAVKPLDDLAYLAPAPPAIAYFTPGGLLFGYHSLKDTSDLAIDVERSPLEASFLDREAASYRERLARAQDDFYEHGHFARFRAGHGKWREAVPDLERVAHTENDHDNYYAERLRCWDCLVEWHLKQGELDAARTEAETLIKTLGPQGPDALLTGHSLLVRALAALEGRARLAGTK
jgi:hypothetical protein